MKTIEEMAREAGDDWDHTLKEDRKFLERFAALVAAAATEAANARANTSWALMCKKMVAAEKEACAKVVDHILKEGGGTYGDAIRARGQA
jgi:hypothetical protein